MEQFDLYLNTLQKIILQCFDRFSVNFRYGIQSVTDLANVTPSVRPPEEAPKEESYSYPSYSWQEQSSSSSPSFRQWLGGLIERGRRRLSEWRDSPHNYELQRKEVFQELAHQYTAWFLEDLMSEIRQQQKPLNALLENIQNTLGDQQLRHIQSTLTTPQEQLALLAEAERLLRGNA